MNPFLKKEAPENPYQKKREIIVQNLERDLLPNTLPVTELLVAGWLNKNYSGEYILYNFSEERQLHSIQEFQTVMDYPLPGNEVAEGGFEWTSPPSLNRIFMIVLEMHAWLSNSNDHRVIVH